MRTDDILKDALTKKRDQERGKHMDGRHLAFAPYDEKKEKIIRSLPLYVGSKEPLQNPDGTFPYMAGYDPLP